MCISYGLPCVNVSNAGSFVYHRPSVIETRFLQLPTYYRLCHISMAITLNMSSLRVFPQSNQDFYFYTTTLDEPLLPWSLINISIPSFTTSLTQMFRNHKLWFIGVVADDFSTVGGGNYNVYIQELQLHVTMPYLLYVRRNE